MTPADATVVVAAAHAAAHDATAQLIRLVELLVAEGHPTEVLLLRGGDRLEELRRSATVRVVDDEREHGAGHLLARVGRGPQAEALVAWRSRRRVRRRLHLPWIVADPEAAWFLRSGDRSPRVIAAVLTDPGAQVGAMAPIDRATLGGAELWLAFTDRQARALASSGTTAAIHVVGSLAEVGDRVPVPPTAGASDPIVLSAPSGAWRAVAHTVEVVAALHERAPDVPLVWLVDPDEDEWLARHDLAHLGLAPGAPISVRRRNEARSLRPRLVVRTGYAASDPDLVLAAAAAQIPTIGFDLGDLPSASAAEAAPFDVEALVDRTIELLDPQVRADVGRALEVAVRHRSRPPQRLAPLHRLLERPEAAAGPAAESR